MRTHAELQVALGKVDDARVTFLAILQASERLRAEEGANHPETLTACQDIADAHCRLGQYAAAEPFCRRATRGRVLTLGIAHCDSLASLCSLASLLAVTGQSQEAERLFLRALAAGGDASWGEACPALLPSLGNLSTSELSRMLKKAQAAKVGVLEAQGEDDTPTFSMGLATILEASGNLREAEVLLRSALEDRESMLGASHQDTVVTMCRLASFLKRSRNHREAETLYRRALDARERKHGPDDAETLACAGRLGGLLQAASCPRESEPLLRRALHGFEATLGPMHPSTLAALGELATALEESRSDEDAKREAERLMRRAVEGLQFVYGLHHRETLRLTKELAQLLKGQGKEQEAWHLYRVALSGAPPLLGVGASEDRPPPQALGCWLTGGGSSGPGRACCSRAAVDDDDGSPPHRPPQLPPSAAAARAAVPSGAVRMQSSKAPLR
mmetsp:Transcript_20128/g.56079  ORF Transcript_20128/g.56079 Transcript_20128/m.56079 type:complete len:446 (-) Transcript_20128:16-1353(-)